MVSDFILNVIFLYTLVNVALAKNIFLLLITTNHQLVLNRQCSAASRTHDVYVQPVTLNKFCFILKARHSGK